jgi:N-formylglutamate amidohydrolase
MYAQNTSTGINEAIDALIVTKPNIKRFVVGIPHCGIYLPANFPRSFGVSKVDDTDIGSEEIFDLTSAGGAVVISRVHRNAVDLNRIEIERNFAQTNRKTKQKKYHGKPLTMDEMLDMYAQYHTPFYDAVGKLIDEDTLLISGHTFNLTSKKYPGICVGDGNGANCSTEFQKKFISNLEMAYSNVAKRLGAKGSLTEVWLNTPFTGNLGITDYFTGCKNRLLIEVNRKLITDDGKLVEGKVDLIKSCLVEAINHSL